MSTRHLIPCAAVLISVIAIVTVFPTSASALAVVAAFLLCPLVMVVAMKLIMSGGHDRAPRHEPTSSDRPELREGARR